MLFTFLGYLGATLLVYLVLSPLAGNLGQDEPFTVLAIMLMMLVPTTHALVIRKRLFAEQLAEERKTLRTNQDTILHAQQRRGLRSQARAIAAGDPAMAQELRIGRPDVPERSYDDGGLLDLNHLPEDTLRSRLTTLTEEDVAGILQARHTLGTFTSVDELLARVRISPGAVAELREFAVFLP